MSSSSETSSVASDSSCASSVAGEMEIVTTTVQDTKEGVDSTTTTTTQTKTIGRKLPSKTPSKGKLSKTEQRAKVNAHNEKIVRSFQRQQKFSHREKAVFDNKVFYMKMERVSSRKLNPFSMTPKQSRAATWYVNSSLAKMIANDRIDQEVFGCAPVEA